MRKLMFVAVAGIVAASLSSCYSPGERALGGGAIGALGGAGIGAAVSHGSTTGTLAGAAIGAASGAALGAATAPQPQPQCARWGVDYYGNDVCLESYYY